MITAYNLPQKSNCYGKGKHTMQFQIQMNCIFLLWFEFCDTRKLSFISDLEEMQATCVSNMANELGRKGKSGSCSNAVATLVIICRVSLTRNTLFLSLPFFPLPCSLVNPHKLDGGRVEGLGKIKRERNRNCVLWKLF
jgi:hypothetical protein